MNILLISHGDFDYDGRLRELFRIFSGMGKLYAITRGSTPQSDTHQLYSGSSYPGFIQASVAFGKKLGRIDLLVLDNRKAVIPGLILRNAIHPKAIIQDCRELYISKEIPYVSGKIGCFFEKKGIKQADIIICANQDRAVLMKDLYHLEQLPLVYENLRQLQYSDEAAHDAQAEKFSKYIHDGEIRIITTSGCSVSRTNDVLVRSLKQIGYPCRLLMVGDSTPSDQQVIEKIIAEEGLKNVEILGKLNQNELKYLIGVSQIGVVNYHQNDQNNKYCASGKLFEFIYEGIPVITTTNPPLKRLCDEAQIGVADDTYADGIRELIKNYSTYQQNVLAFAKTHTVKENNESLSRQLQNRLAKFV